MKTRMTLLTGLFICAVITINAQVSVGPKLGINLANVMGEDVEDNKMKIGPLVGCVFNIPAGDVFSFQPGFDYSSKGAQWEGDEDNASLNYWYLDIPLNGVVNLNAGNGKFQVYAGPNIAMCFAANMKYEGEKESISVQSVDNWNGGDVKMFDIGINAGLGYRINEWQVQTGYGYSFNSYSRYEEADIRHSVISISLAYLFDIGK
jgi:hypothetical protein